MFGRTVTIDGTEIWVVCDPFTPISEVLRRAANKVMETENGYHQVVDLRQYLENEYGVDLSY